MVDALVTLDASWLKGGILETTYVVTRGNGWLEIKDGDGLGNEDDGGRLDIGSRLDTEDNGGMLDTEDDGGRLDAEDDGGRLDTEFEDDGELVVEVSAMIK